MKDRFGELTKDIQLDDLQLITPTFSNSHVILEQASLISNSFEPIVKNIDQLGIMYSRLLNEVQENNKAEMQLIVDKTIKSIQNMLEEERRDLKVFSSIGLAIHL